MRGAAKFNLQENSIPLILLEKQWQYTFYVHAYVGTREKIANGTSDQIVKYGKFAP